MRRGNLHEGKRAVNRPVKHLGSQLFTFVTTVDEITRAGEY